MSESSEGCHIIMGTLSPVRSKNSWQNLVLSRGLQAAKEPSATSVAHGLRHPLGKLQWPLHLWVQRRAIRPTAGAPLEVGPGSLAQRVIGQKVNAGGRQHARGGKRAFHADT